MQEQDKVAELERELIRITQQFLLELNRARQKEALNAFSKFEQELGIDSLGRVELFHRIEEELKIELPESLLVETQTLHDLAVGMMTHTLPVQIQQSIVVHDTSALKTAPEKARSLTEILINRAQYEPDRLHIIFQDENGQETPITYGALYQQASVIAANLQSYGIEPGDTVALMLPTDEDFFPCFMGILLCGAIAVPIYPPLSAHKIEEYAMREAQILKNAEARILITFDKAERLSELLKVFIFSLKAVVTVHTLKQQKVKPRYSFHKDNRPAMIQYTSGSTSLPKGVLLSHLNLLNNIRAVGQVIQLSPADCGISWLPLYHDMGLIGAWFGSFYHGNPVVIMSPLTFLSRPERWLWAMHYHRGTVSAAPNFAFELCCRRIKDEQIKGLDLSSMRLILNGAEKVNPKTLERFSEKFAPYGFKAEVLLPVYGLAESTVGLCIGPIYRKPKVDHIDREIFEVEQRAVPTDKQGVKATTMVSCGQVLPGHEIRIVGAQDQVLPERQVGFLHFRGPSTMLGYYRQEAATQAVTHGDWVDTGDLAYIADNELYITGRKKDVIIKAGRNLYPEEIEEVSSQVDQVRRGCVIAFGVEDAKSGTEKVVIVAEVKDLSKESQKTVTKDIREKCNATLGVVPDEVVLVAPKTIPKTSSGKLQRSACKLSYQAGDLHKKRMPASVQMIKLFFRGLGAKLKQTVKRSIKLLYNGYIAVLLLLSIVSLYVATWVLTYRWFAVVLKVWARVALFVIGCPLYVKGKLPQQQQMIFVANHASYIDAVVLVAVLPVGVLFVGKRELMKVPILSRFLKKYRILTVDRMDFLNNQDDLRIIAEALKQNRPLGIFPEGTFSYATGLRTFKFGAFKVAVETSTSICPVALSGTRLILRGDEKLISPGSITVTLGEPIAPESNQWQEVMRLHDLAKKEIAKGCGEQVIDY